MISGYLIYSYMESVFPLVSDLMATVLTTNNFCVKYLKPLSVYTNHSRLGYVTIIYCSQLSQSYNIHHIFMCVNFIQYFQMYGNNFSCEQ